MTRSSTPSPCAPAACFPLTLILLTLACASSVSAQVCHRGVAGADGTRWQTTVFRATSFVDALPADLEVERIDGGDLVTSARGVIGVAPRAGWIGPIELITRQSSPLESVGLRPPLTLGLQRVTLTAASRELLAFTPAGAGPIESYLGYQTSPDIDESERRTLDAACGPTAHATPIYLDGSSFEDLEGHVARGSDRGRALLGLTAAGFAVALVLGVVAYLRLSGRARVEYADAMLDRRFRELEQRASHGPAADA